MTSPSLLVSHIGGRRIPVGAAAVERENPACVSEVAVSWCPASAMQAREAMDAAANAFVGWAQTDPAERLALLRQLVDGVEADGAAHAEIIHRENGKLMAEAEIEVAAGVADARHLLAVAEDDLRGRRESPESAPVESRLCHEPVGVYLLITPWNFPLATILRKLVPALAYGNTAVIKPSELTPGSADRLMQAIEVQLAAFPGVVNLVLGYGQDVGPALVEHAALRGISFTGSTGVGRTLARSVAGRDVRLQLEMGGKNSLVVLADADLAAAADAAAVGAFSCAGQWCTGTGRVIVEQAVHDEFRDLLVARAAGWRMGPVASLARVEQPLQALAEAVAAGAKVECGGKRDDSPGRESGYFLPPTVVTAVTRDMRLAHEEMFAPVLPILQAANVEEAVELANLGELGLAASIFTRDAARGEILARRLEAGLVHVNLHTAYREPVLPVVGWRESGRGTPECGRQAREFFARQRALYLRRS